MSNSSLAQSIIDKIGGKENVNRAWHCVTRLRFNLVDEDKVDIESIKKSPEVFGAQFQNGQFQIIIGNNVSNVFKEVEGIIGQGGSVDTADQEKEEKKNLISRFLDMISGVFSPVIPAIAGAGMMKGILALLQVMGWISVESDAYQVFTIISDVAFYFLPFLLAVSAARRFKVSEYLALAVTGSLLYPTMTSGLAEGANGLTFLGLTIPFNTYSASVIPVILAVWVLSYVYKFINAIVPKILRIILTPTLVLLIMIPFTLIVAGPIGFTVGDYVGIVIGWLFAHGGAIAGVILGGLLPMFIITGMHYGFLPIFLQNIGKNGYDTAILPLNFINSLAQSGAVFAVALRTKDKKLKSIAASSGFSALLGVTEPALFGVNLKLKRPLYATMIAGAISGGFSVFFAVKCFGVVAQGLQALPVYIDPADSKNLIYAIISVIIAFVVSFVATLLLGFEDVKNEEEEQQDKVMEESGSREFEMFSPLEGNVVPLESVPDKTFSSSLMGPTIAIQPQTGEVVAPFSGEVAVVYPTKHAIGLRSDQGVEALIHIGLETVNLEGKHFETMVQQGQKVTKGSTLVTFDQEAIKGEGYNLVTLMIITNSHELNEMKFSREPGSIKKGEKLLQAK
ncbi:beta-glucoside-specific PTS transporter subunit IIABC [Lederbergia sp. NSJ-179]|uniref:beta-glucoside-specific PTS transporter subunit IIABC n=1 Tax=Lederbergia sp. NSJ-179 TaxID=2931402 RepID=UPI001FD16661|nr:beta-glucoside-specific PTS transporter subunit IIABC [Lederbergia sp. NSJ-179]MCJ7841645.1 beta-glucoside-specific PTS transporter subunit IIABC [Lederbergia sp. NSJ-179]